MEVSTEVFEQQRHPRFGRSNPEHMQLAFWEWMVRSKHGTYHARSHFNVEFKLEDGPIWTFDRMGATSTRLPDGRLICIGGEYEDFYDPDFYIYNDVTIFSGSDQIEIFGYPKEVFPPTDFHTATLWNGKVIIVGGLGYPAERQTGFTPVYAFGLDDYRISQIRTHGEMPGWIYRFRCDLLSDQIIIRDGEIFEERNGRKYYRNNIEDYALDLTSGAWKRITNRNWPHFLIQRMDNKFISTTPPLKPEEFLPEECKQYIVPSEKSRTVRFTTKNVQAVLSLKPLHAELVFEGNLPGDHSIKIAEEICGKIEEAVQSVCLLERV